MWPSRPYTPARAAFGKKHRSAKYRSGVCVYGGCHSARDVGYAKCAAHREQNRLQCAARRQQKAK